MVNATAALTAKFVPAANASIAASTYLGQIVGLQAALLLNIDVFRIDGSATLRSSRC